MESENLDTLGTKLLSEFDSVEDVGCFRLAIRTPFVVDLAVL